MENIKKKTVGPYPVDVIGLGMSPDDLTPAHLRLIEAADFLVGGRRHLSSFKNRVPETYEVTADLKGLVAIIKNRCSRDRIVVLASGDPLYYGIGAYLVRSLGRDQVRIHPNITSVAAAFARMGEPWQDVRVVSLHGRRSEEQLEEALRTADRLAVFTDPTASPQWLGEFLRRSRIPNVQIGVFERMGSVDERVSWHTPESIEAEHFDTPNMVVLVQAPHTKRKFPPLHLGMPEAAFDHQGGLITKTEIRAVSLARLCLRPQQVLWDLGAGSGAVSVEASLLMAGGQIWAVEKNPDRIAQILANRDRFGVPHMEVVQADLPQGLARLPDPDRVFIGGGGRNLTETIAIVCRRLTKNGIVVANTVLMDSLHDTVRCLRAHGLTTDVVQVQVSRSQPLGGSDRMQAMNPVWVIQGYRDAPDDD